MATKRALIVDDSKTAQHRLKRLLQAYDLDIVAVDSAESALSYLSSSVPDVVFMDHLMPGMDGFRALQIIKSHPATAMIPVIMYTSKSGDVYTSQARALGALDVVSKDTINASDLRQVLEAIHIYRRDSAEAAASKTQEPASSTPSAPARSELTNPASEMPGSERDDRLSLELRIRELEHAIDDNRRIITSRLVREVQGVRHEVRKLQPELVDIKHGMEKPKEEAEEFILPPPAPESSHSGWGNVALLGVVGILGVFAWWQLNGSLQTLDERQARLNESVAQITQDRIQEAPSEPVVAVANPSSFQAGASPDQYLPDLSWALNQNSIQDFHRDFISPDLERRLHELLARLSSRDFEGRVQVNVRAGDFCVITNMSGEPQLPSSGAHMESCALMSELHGANATLVMAERLQRVLSEAVLTRHSNIEVDVQRLDREFREYPAMTPSTLADQWNAAARQNNRVLVNLEPAVPRTARQGH